MQANYNAFIDRMISKYEGGYGWDRADPGGPTKYGITCYDLAEFLGRPMNSMSAWAPIVRAMSLETAEQIYARKYATKDRFNDLASGKDCVMLDFGVNSGTLRPIWFAQTMYHMPQSNTFSDLLLAAINSDPQFIDRMCDRRLAFLRGLRTWPVFRGGWSSRVADLRVYAHKIASNQTPDTPPAAITDRMEAIMTAQADYNRLYSLSPPLDVDGFEGPLTKAVTARFQREQGLKMDGIIGPITLAKLAEVAPPPAAVGLIENAEPVSFMMARANDSIEQFMQA